MRNLKLHALIGALLTIGVATVAAQQVQAQTQTQTRATPQADRAAQEAACGGDATRLCGPVIPDEQKIAACLRANRAQVSPACQAMLK